MVQQLSKLWCLLSPVSYFVRQLINGTYVHAGHMTPWTLRGSCYGVLRVAISAFVSIGRSYAHTSQMPE